MFKSISIPSKLKPFFEKILSVWDFYYLLQNVPEESYSYLMVNWPEYTIQYFSPQMKLSYEFLKREMKETCQAVEAHYVATQKGTMTKNIKFFDLIRVKIFDSILSKLYFESNQ